MMKLGRFYFNREVGHWAESETIRFAGTPYEHKSKSRTWVKTGTETVALDVEIDPQKVAKAVSYAVRSKSGISRYLGGGVIGRRVKE